MRKIVECIPNFSEGRDAQKIALIASAIGSVNGVAVLDRTMDADHNRAVITFAGAPDRYCFLSPQTRAPAARAYGTPQQTLI